MNVRTTAAAATYPLTLALNFVRERTPESATRLCAVLTCVTGCGCAAGTVRFAFLHPDAPGTVTALVGVTSALIAAGCVAILSRTRTTDFAAPAPTAPRGDVG